MTVSYIDLREVQGGKGPLGRRPTDEELLWLRIFDSLYAEEAEELTRYEAYYEGDQSIKWNLERFTAIFGTTFAGFRDNFCETVVDTCAERLTLSGFTAVRIEEEDAGSESDATDNEKNQGAYSNASKGGQSDNGDTPPVDPIAASDPNDPNYDPNLDPTKKAVDPELDKLERKASAIWQRNRMDAVQDILHIQHLVKGKGYLICWPDEKKYARIYYNDAELIRCWHDEDGNLTVAAKQWRRPDGSTRRNLYFNDRIEKWELRDNSGNQSAKLAQTVDVGSLSDPNAWSWEPFADDDDDSWPIENPYDRVPVFPFYNKPHNYGEGASELKNVAPLQDGMNKLLADMFVAADYSAFKQKIIASKGRPKEGWKHGPNQLWSTTDTDAKWGEFDATDLNNFIEPIRLIAAHIATTSRTPLYKFMDSGTPPTGESLKTADSSLVKKAEKKQLHLGNAWCEAMRASIEMEMGKDAFPDDVMLEATWESAEVRNEKEFWETAKLKRDAGVPDEIIWEEGNYTQEEIDRMKAINEKQSVEDIGTALLAGFDSGTSKDAKMVPANGKTPIGAKLPAVGR